MNFWAGPITGFSSANDTTRGWPTYPPRDPTNHAPTGTAAEVRRGWAANLERWMPFNLAAFLSVAGPSTYFTQMVWYASYEGFLPCPTAPDTCIGVPSTDMHRPLGAPLGLRQQLSQYKWQRRFEHAVVTLDLEDPLGPGTSIAWS